ncbi:MAG: hypothetical protein KAH18_12780 [Psychromonas sp.]|nr:hypothetical protein [Psychromonas sp.]
MVKKHMPVQCRQNYALGGCICQFKNNSTRGNKMRFVRDHVFRQSKLPRQTAEEPMRPLQDIGQIKNMHWPGSMFAVLKDPQERVHIEFTSTTKVLLRSAIKTLGLILLLAQQVITSAVGNVDLEF